MPVADAQERTSLRIATGAVSSVLSNGEERLPLGTWAGGGGDRAPHETAVERCTGSSRSGTNGLYFTTRTEAYEELIASKRHRTKIVGTSR